jgi:hypothetical protein
MILRFATVLALAVWFGGFTFYSTAVISTSQEVLHSHLRAGLITQQVTNWLNWISLPALAICAGNWLARRTDTRKWWVRIMVASLVVMALMQAGLFIMHGVLDGRIVENQISDDAAFFRLHRIYLALATLQWGATIGYIWTALILWSRPSESPRNESAVEPGLHARRAADQVS